MKFYSILILMMMTAHALLASNESLPNDPYKVKTFTLKNGLTVFLSPNKQTPRIFSMIAVKAGSKYDPAQTTGLAHYLEHMMFKGSHKIGTLDWEKESVILNKISAKYEEHLKEQDPIKKTAIYAEIDKLSYEASKLAVPNEYDKMVGSIGASGTNAFTSNDMTVYVNDIPSNAIEKWAKLESERFSTLVLRLFHTELETVYEEFNRNQDDDIRWSTNAVDKLLMPNHPYGTQTTIGEGEHLKNPSMVNIHQYFDKYYVPNNIAIILSGDVDEVKTMEAIEKYFGKWEFKTVPAFVKNESVPLTKIQSTDIKGPTKEHVILGYRLDGDGSRQSLLATMLDMMLNNGVAGLLDLNLIQKQKVLTANSYVNSLKDYSTFKLYGEPKQGQSLEEVEKMLVAQLEMIKKGEFDDWLLPAIIQNLRLQKMKNVEDNRARAGELMDAFVKDLPWKTKVDEIDELAKVTKADMINFVTENFKDNYAVCYKRAGEPTRHKVDKPKITPVVMNKDSVSAFKKEFDAVNMTHITPKFLNFETDLAKTKTKEGVELLYVPNKLNRVFSLSYVYKLGNDFDKKIGIAADFSNLLGTEELSAEQLKKEFYKLGINFSTSTSRDRVTVSISGLSDHLEKGILLMNSVLKNWKADGEKFKLYIQDLLKKRTNAKLNKGVILGSALVNYAKYGKDNPVTNILSEKELNEVQASELINHFKKQLENPHFIRFYGPQSAEKVIAYLENIKPNKAETNTEKRFKELETNKPLIYFCNYNMKQAEVILLHKDKMYDKNLVANSMLYNDYYGAGLSSILFQEVREKMGLAYAVSSTFSVPANKDEPHYLTAYVGTQADKLKTALGQVHTLLSDMVTVPKQFDGTKSNAVRNMESDWVSGEGVFASYDRAERRGLKEDARIEVYEKLKGAKIEDLKKFFEEKIQNKPFVYCVIGKKENIDFEYLKTLGDLKEVTLEEIFNY